MLQWADLLIKGLATWRLTKLLMDEEGPGDILLKARTAIGIKHDDYNKPFMWPTGNPMYCLWCFSMWIGVACALLPSKWLVPFSLSAIAIIINDWVSDDGKSID